MAEDGVELSAGEAMRGMEAQMHDFSYREGTLAHLRDAEKKRKKTGESPSRIERVNNVLSYLRAERDDAPPDDRSNFTDMLDAASALTDYQHNGATDENLNPVIMHLIGERNHWEEETRLATGEAREIAQHNVELFDSFIETLNQTPQEVTLGEDHPLIAAEAGPQLKIATDEELAALNRESPLSAELPEQKYEPKAAARKLKELKSNETVSFEDVEAFVAAVDNDIPPYNNELIKAVDAAKQFLEQHKGEKLTRKVVVSVSSHGEFKAAWQGRIIKQRSHPGSKYVFNAKGDFDDPKGLDSQALESFRNKMWKEEIKDATSGLENLKEKREITDKEKLAIFRTIERHGKMEEAKSPREIDEDTIGYLKKMSVFIRDHIGPETRSDAVLAA